MHKEKKKRRRRRKKKKPVAAAIHNFIIRRQRGRGAKRADRCPVNSVETPAEMEAVCHCREIGHRSAV